jgi:hypothetical protein
MTKDDYEAEKQKSGKLIEYGKQEVLEKIEPAITMIKNASKSQ